MACLEMDFGDIFTYKKQLNCTYLLLNFEIEKVGGPKHTFKILWGPWPPWPPRFQRLWWSLSARGRLMPRPRVPDVDKDVLRFTELAGGVPRPVLRLWPFPLGMMKDKTMYYPVRGVLHTI